MKTVVKFGGSSLASAEQFKKVSEIVLSDKSRRFVIPSAPGKRFPADIKVTDMLYICYDKAKSGKDIKKDLDGIKSRYQEIIDGLNLKLSLEDEFTVIEKNFKDNVGVDYAASRGEYLNGIVLAKYLDFEFIDAADFIRFDESLALQNNDFDAEATNTMLHKRLENVDYAVIPGFYGAYENGKVKTFSRGGSDITGSIVARAVMADVYENWTDVSGFLIADPRVVDNPKVIETITYRELRELAYMGAGVLHEEAIFPVRREGIPINIRNTNKPGDSGTWIVESTCQKSKYIITGIAGKKGFCAVNIDKDLMNSEIGFGRKVLQAFEDNGISFEHMPSGIDTLTVFVHQDEFADKEQKVVASIHRLAHPDHIDIEGDLAIIAVVGRGMKSTRGTAGRLFAALSFANINIRMMDQGSSELNIIIGVANEDFEAAIKAIYSTFVDSV
ncbi:MAG: aspartate kinase [Lachnospiraceae bacterium]|nr:aspartate kinase [Lachnospiraceae bacterium]